MTRRLRIALAGAGMVSAHHLTAWARIADVEVVAIADPDRAKADERARTFGIPAAFASVEEMVARTRPDALDIATPVETHGDLCRLAAAAGLAILCQKPLGRTADEARVIAADIGDRVPFMIHENWRFRPVWRRIHAWIHDGRVGEPVLTRLSVRSSGFVPDAHGVRPGLVRQPFLATLPRFLVFELLVHHLDILTWLFGPLTVSEARLARLCTVIAAEDTALVSLVTRTGRPVILDACYCDPQAPVAVTDGFDLIGSRGTIRLDGRDLRHAGTASEHHTIDPSENYAASYEGALRHFVTALRTGQSFETSPAAHIACLDLVEAIYAQHAWIKQPELAHNPAAPGEVDP
jgi:predicted dehydrogenase